MNPNNNSKLSVAEATRRRMRAKFPPKSPPGKASDYLHHLDEYHKLHPDIWAIPYCRESSGAQQYTRHNLDMYEDLLHRETKKQGIPIAGNCHREISSGWILNEDRWALMEAVKEAKKLIAKGREAVIVAPSTDRFLRNRDFTTKEPDLTPTEAEFQILKELTCNIPLLTLLHPDMPPKEVRSYQTKWGQEAKGNKGGRPEKKTPGYKKRRRDRKRGRVIRLYKQGVTISGISRETRVPPGTIYGWLMKDEG